MYQKKGQSIRFDLPARWILSAVLVYINVEAGILLLLQTISQLFDSTFTFFLDLLLTTSNKLSLEKSGHNLQPRSLFQKGKF
jgi:hypothetical protein